MHQKDVLNLDAINSCVILVIVRNLYSEKPDQSQTLDELDLALKDSAHGQIPTALWSKIEKNTDKVRSRWVKKNHCGFTLDFVTMDKLGLLYLSQKKSGR